MSSQTSSEYDVQVGRILGAHALKGTVRVAPMSDIPGRHQTLKEVMVRTPKANVLLKVEKAAASDKGTWLMRFEGVSDRTAAEALAGGIMYIREQDLAPLPEGRYYVHQIIGLRVVTVDGRELGPITDVLETGANDVYVTETVLIPAIEQVVKEVDLQAGTMLIDPLPGMIEEEATAEDEEAEHDDAR